MEGNTQERGFSLAPLIVVFSFIAVVSTFAMGVFFEKGDSGLQLVTFVVSFISICNAISSVRMLCEDMRKLGRQEADNERLALERGAAAHFGVGENSSS